MAPATRFSYAMPSTLQNFIELFVAIIYLLKGRMFSPFHYIISHSRSKPSAVAFIAEFDLTFTETVFLFVTAIVELPKTS